METFGHVHSAAVCYIIIIIFQFTIISRSVDSTFTEIWSLKKYFPFQKVSFELLQTIVCVFLTVNIMSQQTNRLAVLVIRISASFCCLCPIYEAEGNDKSFDRKVTRKLKLLPISNIIDIFFPVTGSKLCCIWSFDKFHCG